MMENTILDSCSRITNIINISVETVWLFRQQYFFRGHGKLNILTAELQKSLQEILDIAGVEYLNNMGVSALFDAQEKDDEILIADIIEGQVIPSLEQLVQELQQSIPLEYTDFYLSNLRILRDGGNGKLVDKIENASKRQNCEYIPEYTATGQITIRVVEGDNDYYISGNNNPYLDAIYFIQGNIEQDKYQYVILGAGMLFEVQALLTQRPDAQVVVVEEDAFLLKLVLTYRELSGILLDDRLSIECCDYDEFIANTDLDNQCILIRKPAMRHMRNHECRMTLERFFVKSMTIKEQAYVLEKEFRKNTSGDRIVKSVDECRDRFRGRTVYLVAGGPSLNHSIDVLKDRDEDSVILCVGTSLSLLNNAGITPDFVIITDVAETMYYQLNNIDSKDISLLYMISANAKAVAAFKGEKYAIFQKGFDMAEEYASKHNYMLVSTGGSVSTTALDICIRMECKKVVCLGLDLAYTGNRTHAEGTLMDNKISKTSDMPMVKSVSGEMIPTSLNLSCYHKWIEERISGEDEIEFVNISNGAYIDGMENRRLYEQ